MIRDPSTGHAVRRFSAALVLPVLLAAGCGGPSTSAVPPPTSSVPTGQTGTPTVAPTVRTLPNRSTQTSDNTDGAQSSGQATVDQSYMPFATGRSWTYNVVSTTGGQTTQGTVTWTVDSAAPDNTAVTVVSEASGQRHVVNNKVVKNADGTVTITTTTDGQAQTQTVKPEDIPQGTQTQTPGATQQATSLQGTKESVTVAAGSFDAIKVVNTLPEGKGSVTAWYAPDVGMVKQDIQATTDSGAVTSSMELTSYK